RAEPQLVGFLDYELQERWRADVARGREIGDHARLHFRLPDAARDHRAAEVVQAGLEHAAGGRVVVGEAIEVDVARAKARGVERAAGAPEVGRLAFRAVDRLRRHEDPGG